MLTRTTYFIRERVALMKLSDTYDIIDPQTQQQIGIAQERPGGHIHALRFILHKRLLPTKVFVYEGTDPKDQGKLQFSIVRGMTFLRSKVDILDPAGNLVGWLKSKAFSLGGAFFVFDSAGNQVASVKGDWKGWNFRFLDSAGEEIGTITKKWAGFGKEFFTSADSYVISLNGEPSRAASVLLLAAGLAVDTVYKER